MLSLVVSEDSLAAAICKNKGPAPDYADDYRDRLSVKHMYLVEKAHFTPEVTRFALRGTGDRAEFTYLGIDYLLRHFPNDPRGLRLMGIYTHKLKTGNKTAWRQITQLDRYQPLECYFSAARRFAPDDHNVANALGIYLNYVGDHKKAIAAFKEVVKAVPDSASAHYNLALSYYSAKRYQDSLASAKRAYQLGYKKTDLKVRLKRKGVWK